MSDRFQVAAESEELLATSYLIEEMKHFSGEMDVFPVLIGDFVAYFHDVSGGYHRSGGYNVVNLIHKVQGQNSPPSKTYADQVEVHFDGQYFFFEVEDVWEFSDAEGRDYPDANYVLSLKVIDYRQGPYAFSEQLQTEVDKRETEYQWEG